MNELTLPQMKEYLKTVFDLEKAIYKNKEIAKEYQQKKESSFPKMPEKKMPIEPSKPELKLASQAQPSSENNVLKNNPGMLFLLLIWGITSFIGFFDIFFPLSMASKYGWEYYQSMEIRGVVFAIISFIIGFFIVKKIKIEKERNENIINDENKRLEDNYQKQLEKFKNDCRLANENYSTQYSNYIEKRRICNNEMTDVLSKLSETQRVLENQLTMLYSKNIIYSKYRNLVSIASIYEYFESGRCSELEGPNGAYNLYEGELRANIIICSLSQIISDLNQIKSGQYALFEAINNSSREISLLLSDINNTQRLTAYYAEAAAVAASADRISYGIIM